MPLSDLGTQQARAAASNLSRTGVRRIVSSPLLRALATAEWLGRATGLTVEVDERLRERVFPSLYGVTYEEIESRHGRNVRDAFESGNSDLVSLPGVDELPEYARRLRALRLEILQAGTSPMVIVSHGGPHEWLVNEVLGIRDRGRRWFTLDKCRVTVLDFNRTSRDIHQVVALNISPRDYAAMVSGDGFTK
jgi:probable phosphoglycerate mutase